MYSVNNPTPAIIITQNPDPIEHFIQYNFEYRYLTSVIPEQWGLKRGQMKTIIINLKPLLILTNPYYVNFKRINYIC